METNDRMVPSDYDIPDTYRCLDCEALLSSIASIMRGTCDQCEQEWREQQ